MFVLLSPSAAMGEKRLGANQSDSGAGSRRLLRTPNRTSQMRSWLLEVAQSLTLPS